MKKGVTLLEILVSIAIISVVVAFTSAGFSRFYKSNNLGSDTHNTLSQINEARAKSISSEGASQYGVHFNATSSTLFKGVIFIFGDSNNDEIIFSQSIEISNISLNGGGSDIVFKRLTGETDEYGTVTLRQKSDTSKTKIIEIKESGIAEVD